MTKEQTGQIETEVRNKLRKLHVRSVLSIVLEKKYKTKYEMKLKMLKKDSKDFDKAKEIC